MSEAHQSDRDTARTTADVRHSWWPGWIWAVPVAVVLIAIWLGVRALTSQGEDIVITFTEAHGATSGNTMIVYRGVKVGSVNAVKLNSKGDGVEVDANIDSSAAKYLKAGTRFWMRGANPSLSHLSSLAALLSGPTIVMVPGAGKPASRFAGLTHKPLVIGPHGPPQHFIVAFEGAAGGLSRGGAVTLRGFTVGRIEDVGFRYDPKTGAVGTPVTLALYPSLFHIQAPASGRGALRAAVTTLVQKGLRARLERDPPLVGSYRVTLDMVPGAAAQPPALLNGLPQIPVAPGGGLNAVVTRLNKVPVDQIAQNVLDITHHADQIVSSPKLKDSVSQLDASLKEIHSTTKAVGPQITKLIATLRQTAGQLDHAAKAADKTLGGVPSQTGLHETLREITDAARSIRGLADYLDRHPEALIKGRSGG